MEERIQRDFDSGKMTGKIWNCDEIQVGHAISRFTEYLNFSSSSQKDVVRMHFGLKGNYSFSYKQ